MIKSIALIAMALTFSAQANCIGEAQIIGRISEVRKTLTSCRAFLSADTRIQTSMACPLDEGKLYSEGIEVGLMNGHDCKMEAGDSISGILVDNGHQIILE